MGNLISSDIVLAHFEPENSPLNSAESDSADFPSKIGEALPDHHCEENPKLELCSTDAPFTFKDDEIHPYQLSVGVIAFLLVSFAIFHVGKLYFTTGDKRVRIAIEVAAAFAVLSAVAGPYISNMFL